VGEWESDGYIYTNSKRSIRPCIRSFHLGFSFCASYEWADTQLHRYADTDTDTFGCSSCCCCFFAPCGSLSLGFVSLHLVQFDRRFFGSIRDVVKGKGSETNEPDQTRPEFPARLLPCKTETQTQHSNRGSNRCRSPTHATTRGTVHNLVRQLTPLHPKTSKRAQQEFELQLQFSRTAQLKLGRS